MQVKLCKFSTVLTICRFPNLFKFIIGTCVEFYEHSIFNVSSYHHHLAESHYRNTKTKNTKCDTNVELLYILIHTYICV